MMKTNKNRMRSPAPDKTIASGKLSRAFLSNEAIPLSTPFSTVRPMTPVSPSLDWKVSLITSFAFP